MFDALQQRANKQLISKIDKSDYDESDLITVKVPLSMPYLTNWNDFKRTDGEVTLNGKIYHYVKEKVFNGELILMCLPDENKMNLQTAKNDFFKTQNDLQNNTSKNSGENNHAVKFSISDYIKTEIAVSAFAVDNIVNTYTDNYFIHLQSGDTLIPEQPPKA